MEIRVALKAADVRAEGERVTAAFKEWVDAGARHNGGSGGGLGWVQLAAMWGRACGMGAGACWSGGGGCGAWPGPAALRPSARENERWLPCLPPPACFCLRDRRRLLRVHIYVAGCCGASHWQLEKENYEGWRVKVDEGDSSEGWILLRPSLHDPGAPRPWHVQQHSKWRSQGCAAASAAHALPLPTRLAPCGPLRNLLPSRCPRPPPPTHPPTTQHTHTHQMLC